MQNTNWDDIRLFLAVARAGRLSKAGELVGLDHSTVGRRMAVLEARLGTSLFHRSPRGVALTVAGERLLHHAEAMEGEWAEGSAAVGEQTGNAAGIVRLATPEVFGTHLVAPQIGRLRATHPDLELELVPHNRTISLSRREADMAVTLTRPPKGRVVARRLIDYRVGLYASHDYLAAKGPIADVSGHPMIWYIDDLIDMPELRYFGQLVAGGRSVFRSSSVTAQHAAVAAGVGIGVLHALAADQDSRLVRILPGVEVIRSYWLLFHADQQRLPRIRAVVDFLLTLIEDRRGAF